MSARYFHIDNTTIAEYATEAEAVQALHDINPENFREVGETEAHKVWVSVTPFTVDDDGDPDWGAPVETLEIIFGEGGRYASDDTDNIYLWPEPSDRVQVKYHQ